MSRLKARPTKLTRKADRRGLSKACLAELGRSGAAPLRLGAQPETAGPLGDTTKPTYNAGGAVSKIMVVFTTEGT